MAPSVPTGIDRLIVSESDSSRLCIERLRDLTTHGFWCRSDRSRCRVNRLRRRVADRLQAHSDARGRMGHNFVRLSPQARDFCSIASLLGNSRAGP